MQSFKSRLDQTKERICDLEYNSFEIIQSQKKKAEQITE